MRLRVFERASLAAGGIFILAIGYLLTLVAWACVYEPLGMAANTGALLCALSWLFVSDAASDNAPAPASSRRTAEGRG